MKRKVVLGVLALIVILVLSATAAQASGGGKPYPLTSFFVCHAINGEAPGQGRRCRNPRFRLADPAEASRSAAGSLACAFAKLFPPGIGNADHPVPERLATSSSPNLVLRIKAEVLHPCLQTQPATRPTDLRSVHRHADDSRAPSAMLLRSRRPDGRSSFTRYPVTFAHRPDISSGLTPVRRARSLAGVGMRQTAS